MPWKKFESKGVIDWESEVTSKSKTTNSECMRFALQNPNIAAFLYCSKAATVAKRKLKKGDAVFFSAAKKSNESPNCTLFAKDYTTIVYINPNDPTQVQSISANVTSYGTPEVDVIALFAGNYASDQLPYLRANNNDPPTTNPLNANILNVLQGDIIKNLQDQGISVILSILNGHSQVGWSQFSNEQSASDFAIYLKTDIVDKYGLDGIDIDDEYSAGTPIDNSLAMVTTKIRDIMPNILLTKALYNDYQNFSTNWNGHTLGENLTYGCEMGYRTTDGGENDVTARLSFYNQFFNKQKQRLLLGFSAEDRFPLNDYPNSITAIKSLGYGGFMLFGYEFLPRSQTILQNLLKDLDETLTLIPTKATEIEEPEKVKKATKKRKAARNLRENSHKRNKETKKQFY